MEIFIETVGQVNVIAPRGPLLGHEAISHFREALERVNAGDCRRLVVRLDDVTDCDSEGLHEIVRTHRALGLQGGALKLVRPDAFVLKLLQLTQVMGKMLSFPPVSRCMGLYARLDEALASFEPVPYDNKELVTQTRDVGEYTIIDTWGKLVLGNTACLVATVDGLLTQGRKHLLFNLEGIPFLDSTGIKVLCHYSSMLYQAGGICWWMNPVRRIEEVLWVTK